MKVQELLTQWDQSVQNLHTASEDHSAAESELERSTVSLKTSVSAGKYECWGPNDETCGNCTDTWTYRFC